MSGDDRQNSPSISRQNRPSATRIVKGGIEELSDDLKNKAAGIRTFPTGFEALMKTEDISGFPNLTVDPATIDEIVVFTSKKGDDYE